VEPATLTFFSQSKDNGFVVDVLCNGKVIGSASDRVLKSEAKKNAIEAALRTICPVLLDALNPRQNDASREKSDQSPRKLSLEDLPEQIVSELESQSRSLF
jgi:hypothetical protein